MLAGLRSRCLSTVAPQSYVQRGTTFENLAVSSLARLGFRLRWRGGPHDGGIDFKARYWKLDSDVPVVGQCKHQDGTISVGSLREFIASIPPHEQVNFTSPIGLFVTNATFSRDCLGLWRRSPHALALCCIEPNSGSIVSFAMNGPAQDRVPTVAIVSDVTDTVGDSVTVLLHGQPVAPVDTLK